MVSILTALHNFKFFHLYLIQTESSYRCQTHDNEGDQKQMERPNDERCAIITEINGSRRPTVVEVMEDDELIWYIIIFIVQFK